MTIPHIGLERILKSKAESLKTLIVSKLWIQILMSLVLGIFAGFLLGPDVGWVTPTVSRTITNWLALPGNLFLQLIKMVIIPLIFSSIIMGIIASGNPTFIRKIGPRLLVYFVITTIIATTLGLLVSFVIKPGNYFETDTLGEASDVGVAAMGENTNIPDTIVGLLPNNPLESMVRGDMLGVVIFTIIFGVALLFVAGPRLKHAIKFLQTVQDVTMRVVKWAMYLVPYAVFGLMTQVLSQTGLKSLQGLGMYMLTVLIGLALLMVVYLLIVWIFIRKNPFHFLNTIKNALIIAFSTSSSAATMPVSMKVAEDHLDVKPSISEFIIPVGATINMDGTALYQVVATVFLAQAFGVELSIYILIMIIALTVGASIGAPSAPGTGIIILATILESVGIPVAGLAIILGVDRILDMCRTSVNVTGDLTAAMFFNKYMGKYFG